MSKSGRLLYRRVRPEQWEDTSNRSIPKETLFHLTDFDLKGKPVGLSVCLASQITPFRCLEIQLDIWKRQKRTAKLNACNASVEGMVEVGWGVIAVYEDVFLSRGFIPQPDEEIDENGHFVMQGTASDFLLHSIDFVDLCQSVAIDSIQSTLTAGTDTTD